MGNISLKGILLGILICIAGSVIGGVFLGLFLSLFYEDLSHAQLFVPSLIVVLPVLIAAGYLTALVSQKWIYVNAGIVGIFGVFVGFFFPLDITPLKETVSLLLPLPATLFGGLIYVVHKRMYQDA